MFWGRWHFPVISIILDQDTCLLPTLGHHHIYVTIEGGTLFSLLVMFTVSSVAGWLVQCIHLPPLLGMLLTGVLLRNVPYIDVAKGVDPAWYNATRTTALVVILLRYIVISRISPGFIIKVKLLKELVWD